MYLSVKVQEVVKENYIWGLCVVRDTALNVRSVHTGHSMQILNLVLSRVFLGLNALKSIECLYWQGIKTRANENVLCRHSSGPNVFQTFTLAPGHQAVLIVKPWFLKHKKVLLTFYLVILNFFLIYPTSLYPTILTFFLAVFLDFFSWKLELWDII